MCVALSGGQTHRLGAHAIIPLQFGTDFSAPDLYLDESERGARQSFGEVSRSIKGHGIVTVGATSMRPASMPCT
jgi:hypothetical protein